MPFSKMGVGLKTHPVICVLVLWLCLEGLMHGWAAGVGGQVPSWMDHSFSFMRSVLAYLWWRGDRLQHRTLPRLWLSGLLIAFPWLGCLLHLVLSRSGRARAASVVKYFGLLLMMGVGYVVTGGLMAYAWDGL